MKRATTILYAILLVFLATTTIFVPTGCAQVTTEGTSCTDLGLISNNANAGEHNMALLRQAVLGGRKVLVDGVYYLNYGDEVPLSNTIISLTGTTPDAKFILDGSRGPLFNIRNNVDVDISNINFIEVDTSMRYILTFASDCLSNKVVLDNNTFAGKMRLLEFKGSTTIDPSVRPFGIKELYFTNNTVDNANVTFIRADDMPSDKIVIEGNTIHNFDFTFFSNAITNDIPYLDEMYAAKKLMIVRNNWVTCDDNWWGNPGNPIYYCFVLFEGIDCTYEGNHVEGLKFYSGSGSGAAVYDAYLSCLNLNYNNNVWKNIINLNPSKQNNTLLKSKGGPPNTKLTRHYENNTFIIEKSYIEKCSAQVAARYSQDPAARLSQDLSSSWVEFIGLTKVCSNYEIINNKFNVYSLRLTDNYLPVEHMDMEGNVFNCNKIIGSLWSYHLVDKNGFAVRSNIIQNNEINCKFGFLLPNNA